MPRVKNSRAQPARPIASEASTPPEHNAEHRHLPLEKCEQGQCNQEYADACQQWP
jgi:hypothetical protein